MRVYLLQHMLASYFGHWFNETTGWIAAARAADVELKVYGSTAMTPDVVRLTGARGVYELTNDIVSRFGLPGRFAEKPAEYCQPLVDFMAWSETFREACVAIGKDGIGADDLLAVPFATINEVHGMALWLERVPAARRPAVLFNFHQPHHSWHVEQDRDRAKADFMFSRYAGLRLRALLPERRIIITAAEPRLGKLMQQALMLPCHITPMLMNYGDYGVRDAASPRGRALTVSVMGDFRQEKGSLQVIDALSGMAQQRPDTRFFVQVRRAEEADALRRQLQRSAPAARLDAMVGPVSAECYADQLLRSDIAFLPYSWQRYAIRTSGVFAEALACGLPVVVPDNTWMSDQLAQGHGAGETFAEWTPQAMAGALLRAAERIDALHQQALVRSPAWRSAQSIHAYLPRVLGLWRNGA
jgi:glycosyltransferase involved in cell wall biosynthesis